MGRPTGAAAHVDAARANAMRIASNALANDRETSFEDDAIVSSETEAEREPKCSAAKQIRRRS